MTKAEAKTESLVASATNINPYLFFGGRCEAALAFYRDRLGATIDCMMRFSEMPAGESGSEGCPGGNPPGDGIMHAQMTLGSSSVFLSDGMPGDTYKSNGYSLSLNVQSDEEAERVFGVLAEGGQVQVPLMESFFATRFGCVTDAFGIPWMVVRAKPCD